MKLNSSFFENKTTLQLARELVGKVLVYESSKGIIKGIINETEAYTQEDESCHAFGGRETKRNEVMFRGAGHFYVYFTYGMYHCCNIVTGKEGKGEAVLVRSVIPLEGEELMMKNRKNSKRKSSLSTHQSLCGGPAKLAMAYGFGKVHNGVYLLDENSKLYLEDLEYEPEKVEQTRRIGISKAIELEWRFVTDEFSKSKI